ncbi:hypothetical protein BDV95DRAFT_506022 [Massariosphaeria phaeospora]|uniref:Uncharacterized protein n=1 Tax=Massariosphaeria phaeospora TaxID=100035 RepID=A0A7C8I5Z9_9PLEO|nr:hypothetical protein BDV95DRAFT_506022 [Massariosphaeria phaeospora]
MAPPDAVAAGTAGAPPKPPRRAVGRIVPAVPLALSRPPPAARPMTPEASTPETVTQDEPAPASDEPQTQPAKGQGAAEQAAAAAADDAPLTPDSKTSAMDNGHVVEPTPASPVEQAHDQILETSPDSQVSGSDQASASAPEVSSPVAPEPAPAAVNGAHHVAAPPTELPPPFYPSIKAAVQSPAMEYTEAPFQPPPPTQMQFHRARPSVESIVFGAAQESPAIPSTPQEPEKPAAHHAFARPPPGFAPPPFTPFYPGHAHHPSEPSASFVGPAYTMAPPEAMYVPGRDYMPPHSAGTAAYQGPFQGLFSAGQAPSIVNGAIRSHSQSPNKSLPGEKQPGSDFSDEARGVPWQNGVHYPRENFDQSSFALADYLSAQVANPEFADFILQVRSGRGLLISLPVHGIVVARSAAIADAIRYNAHAAGEAKDSRKLLEISTFDEFSSPDSMSEAVKVLYGAPLLPVNSLRNGLGPYNYDGEQGPTFTEARRRMGQAMSYASAAKVFQILGMYNQGIQLVQALVRWDTVDQALHFGLCGCVAELGQQASGARDSYAAAFLHQVLAFIAYNFPVDFNLYTFAAELRDDPRLPQVFERKMPSHNPRLSKIRFGDAPPQDDLKPSYVTRTLSSILLSLPLHLIEQLFNNPATASHLGWTGVVKIMRDVVDEREKRRRNALKSEVRPSANGTLPRALMDNMYLEERLEASSTHPSGYRLVALPLEN